MGTSRKLPLRILGIAAVTGLVVLAVSGPSASAATPPFLRAFGPGGFTASVPAGAFTNLQGIAVDQANGDVYAYDAGIGSIYKFNAAGEPANFSGLGTNVITGAGEPHNNEGELAVDNSTGATKGNIYVSTGNVAGNANQNEVLIFNEAGEAAKPGSTIKEEAGVPWGELCGVATGTDGDVYVALYKGEEESRVNRYNAAGEYEESLFGLNDVCNLTVNSQGAVYTAKYKVGPVLKYEPSQFNTTETAATGTELDPYGATLSANLLTSEAFVDELTTIAQYNASGELVGNFGESLNESYGVAVNDAGGQVYVDNETTAEIFGPEPEIPGPWVTEAAANVTTTTATLNGTVDPEGAPVPACEFEYGTSTSYGHTVACEQTSSEIGEGISPVAVSAEVSGLEPGKKYYFRVLGTGTKGAGHGRQESSTTHEIPPTVTIKLATDVTAHCATLHGGVNPNGFATTYQFEDSTNGTTWTPLGSAGAGEGESESPVAQSVCGLSGSTTYDVRLTAENDGGSTTSGEATFPTPPAAPLIEGVGVSVLNSSQAALYATIHPERQTATYRFEYGTTSAYGTIVPAGEGDAGTTITQVSQNLQGLTFGSTYRFRVVAINATGTTYGTEQTFTTPLVAAEAQRLEAGPCPKEALRAESNIDALTGVPYSMQLPDCRAYEMVTPPFKSYGNLILGAGGLATADIRSISSNGSSLLVDSVPFLGTGAVGADEVLTGTYYALERGVSGWTTTSLTAPASVFPISNEELASPADAAVGLWAAAIPSQSIHAEDFYRREGDGAFTNIGPIAPASATAGPPRGAKSGPALAYKENSIVGASVDLSDVVFQMDSAREDGGPSQLWPGDGTVFGNRPSLYEYVGGGHTGEGTDVPGLVGVNNAGAQISQCGTGLGADVGTEPQVVHNGISAGGSTTFFNARAGGCVAEANGPATNQVYARIGAPGATQVTVNVTAQSQSDCGASVSCNVTSPVTFQGASSDGSKVFFTAAQAGLIAGDTDATNALYECELPGDGGATPAPTGLVNACPDLKAVSVTDTNSGANVQSVVAVSEEGSRVYFTATGVLTKEPDLSLPVGHQAAEAGKDNLYVWEALGAGNPSGHVAFVATLSEASPKEAQATPDGLYLVFTTATPELVSGDTSTTAQAFRYDTQSGELVRVSIGQEGFNNDGNTDVNPASLANTTTELGRLTISEDGSYVVFQSNDALTPLVHGGTKGVYEWHDGEVHLVTDGVDTNNDAGLLGVDASGTNIFFTTSERLVAQDTDEDVDVYDARIDGGFPAPTPTASCNGEACQGPLTTPLASPLVGSTSAPAIGNVRPPVSKPVKPKPKSKSLTSPQKLAKVLTSCRKEKLRARRQRCEKQAKAKYGGKSTKASGRASRRRHRETWGNET